MSAYWPPKKRPSSARRLGELVSSYAEAEGLGVRRVRHRVTAMAFIGALERVRKEDSPSRFLFKGGMACELRFHGKARTTRDLDAVFHGSIEELLEDLDVAFAESYSGFRFRHGEPEAIRETGSHRLDIDVGFEGGHWGTLKVEVSAPEGKAFEPETVDALTVSEFGLEGPIEVVCLSLRYQIAQKIHACTERFEDRTNDRAHDLIDLLLMEELIEDYQRVREACVEIFAIRATHDWPPTLTVEPGWADVYAALAAEIDFPVTDVNEAAALVQALTDRIDVAV